MIELFFTYNGCNTRQNLALDSLEHGTATG